MLLPKGFPLKLTLFSIAIVCGVVSLVVYFCVLPIENAEYLQVLIPQGILVGRYGRTMHNLKYASFEGIPYAQAPIGKLRFKDPLRAQPWDGARKVIGLGPECAQITQGQGTTGTEDCLVLNVYSPSVTPGELAPVMVWIHGGAFVTGSANRFAYPDLFMRDDVVLVTVNYRLGIFGYLSLDTEEVPGNAAMKDKVMALRWVRDNIEQFGGNRDRVTVFGESSGGAAVSLMQASPMARHLVHRAISMSGVGLSGWSMKVKHAETADRVAAFFNLTRSSPDFLGRLQSFATDDILEAAMSVGHDGFDELAFAPIVEREFNNTDAFLSRKPIEYIKTGDFNHIPCVFGYTSFEYAYFYDENAPTWNASQLLIRSIFKMADDELTDKILEKVNDFYRGSQLFNPGNREMLIGEMNLLGDLLFVRGIDEAVRLNAKHSNESTYYFRFSYRGNELGSRRIGELGLQGATHCDPGAYLFPRESAVDEESSDGWVRRRLIKMFANFARTGNPTPDPHSDLLPTVWPAVTRDELRYLEINGESTPGVDPDGGRLQFWRDLHDFVEDQLLEKSPDGRY